MLTRRRLCSQPETTGRSTPIRSLVSDAVAQIGRRARQSHGRGFATPCYGMAELRTPRVATIWSSR